MSDVPAAPVEEDFEARDLAWRHHRRILRRLLGRFRAAGGPHGLDAVDVLADPIGAIGLELRSELPIVAVGSIITFWFRSAGG